MPEKILIIEDEEKIARVLQLELEFEGYTVDVAHTGTDGLIKYRENKWDIILLDIMLPEMSGFDVLKRIRSTEYETAVILLTAKDEVADKVKGLDLGANDYLTKPFEIEELLARVRARARFKQMQKTKKDPSLHNYRGLSLHEKTREIYRDEKLIELTPREYELLLFLLHNANQVMSREQILNNVWGFDYYGDTNVVDVYIRYLRQKVDHGYEKTLIQTVRGVGYVLREL